jgi:hypothetical protein
MQDDTYFNDMGVADAAAARYTLSRRLKKGHLHNIVDQTGTAPGEVAIYALADPRDVRAVRYVGQTRTPPARYSQHVNTARLWLPDLLPWWVKREELRPLYAWIRELYCEDGRLPMMFIVGWTGAELARHDERRFIRAYLEDGLPLLNGEVPVFRERLKRSFR